MKSEITTIKTELELNTPCLMTYYNAISIYMIILAIKIFKSTNTFEGTVIYHNPITGVESCKMGEYSKTWTLSSFRPFTGEIKLSN